MCKCDVSREAPRTYAEVLNRCQNGDDLQSTLSRTQANATTWAEAFECRECGRQWIGERPFSEHHGGGALCLFLSPVPDAKAWILAGNDISGRLRAAHEAFLFNESLGPESGPQLCRSPGCDRPHIANSVMCATHHAAMIGR